MYYIWPSSGGALAAPFFGDLRSVQGEARRRGRVWVPNEYLTRVTRLLQSAADLLVPIYLPTEHARLLRFVPLGGSFHVGENFEAQSLLEFEALTLCPCSSKRPWQAHG